jgi:hypothetical protein
LQLIVIITGESNALASVIAEFRLSSLYTRHFKKQTKITPFLSYKTVGAWAKKYEMVIQGDH